MPPVKRSSGLRGFPSYVKKRKRTRTGNWKKNKVNGRKGVKALKRTKMGRVGLNAALALKTLKKHEVPSSTTSAWGTRGIGSGNQSGGQRCICYQPFELAQSPTRSETARESDDIYFFNCRGEFEIAASPTTLGGFQIRFIQGWSKGAPDLSNSANCRTPKEGLSATVLAQLLPTTEDKLNGDHYKVEKDYIRICSPKDVIPERENIRLATTAELVANYVLPEAERLQGHYIEHGMHHAPVPANTIWRPCKFRYNKKFNRVVRYDGASSSDCIGWLPFVAILLYEIPGSYLKFSAPNVNGTVSDPTHTNTVSPTVKFDMHSFFKDC